MKILILSDSHSSLHFMREAIRYFSPNAVIHLGDYYDDGTAMAEEFPDVRFYQVPGNCDKYRNIMGAPEILVCKVCGVKLYLTHGHCHYVKSGLWSLLKDARRAGVQCLPAGSVQCRGTGTGPVDQGNGAHRKHRRRDEITDFCHFVLRLLQRRGDRRPAHRLGASRHQRPYDRRAALPGAGPQPGRGPGAADPYGGRPQHPGRPVCGGAGQTIEIGIISKKLQNHLCFLEIFPYATLFSLRILGPP